MFHGDRGWREPGFRWGSRAQRRPIEPGSAWDTTGQPEGTPGVAEAMASPREAACAARRANKGQEKTPAKSTAPLARRRRASVVRTTGIERGFGSGLTVRYRHGPRYRHGCAAEVARPKQAKPQSGTPKSAFAGCSTPSLGAADKPCQPERPGIHLAQWARLAPRDVQLCLSTQGDNRKSEGDMPMPTHMNCMAYFSCNMRLSRDSMRAASESR